LFLLLLIEVQVVLIVLSVRFNVHHLRLMLVLEHHRRNDRVLTIKTFLVWEITLIFIFISLDFLVHVHRLLEGNQFSDLSGLLLRQKEKIIILINDKHAHFHLLLVQFIVIMNLYSFDLRVSIEDRRN
jgi:hypothetical protein